MGLRSPTTTIYRRRTRPRNTIKSRSRWPRSSSLKALRVICSRITMPGLHLTRIRLITTLQLLLMAMARRRQLLRRPTSPRFPTAQLSYCRPWSPSLSTAASCTLTHSSASVLSGIRHVGPAILNNCKALASCVHSSSSLRAKSSAPPTMSIASSQLSAQRSSFLHIAIVLQSSAFAVPTSSSASQLNKLRRHLIMLLVTQIRASHISRLAR